MSLIDKIQMLRREHYVSGYSCIKSGLVGPPLLGGSCTCGADRINAIIDDLILEVIELERRASGGVTGACTP